MAIEFSFRLTNGAGECFEKCAPDEIEALCEAQGREWIRLVLEEHMALRAQMEKRVEVTGADGTPRPLARQSERHRETLLGTIAVRRLAYQAPGIGASVCPRGSRAMRWPRLEVEGAVEDVPPGSVDGAPW